MRADDREAVALIEPAGAVVLLPDIEKDVGRAFEARMIECGVQQLLADAAGLKGRLDIEPPHLLVAGRAAGRWYLERAELRIADRAGVDGGDQEDVGLGGRAEI